MSISPSVPRRNYFNVTGPGGAATDSAVVVVIQPVPEIVKDSVVFRLDGFTIVDSGTTKVSLDLFTVPVHVADSTVVVSVNVELSGDAQEGETFGVGTVEPAGDGFGRQWISDEACPVVEASEHSGMAV